MTVTDLNRAAAPLTVEEIRESFRATGNYLSEVLHIDPCGDAIVDALEPLFPDIAESMIPAKSFERSEAENRLRRAQMNMAAARDSGDRDAMLAAHDAVERAAAEVAGQ